jgi:hypothetical protein
LLFSASKKGWIFDHTLKTGCFSLEYLISNFHHQNFSHFGGVESDFFFTFFAQIGGVTLRCRGGDASWGINPTDSS